MAENILKTNNPICQKCIKEQLKKYKNFIGDQGQTYEGFSISCKGIPTSYIGKALKVALTQEELDDALAVLDPVHWAKKYLRLPDGSPWVARWYQELMLRCTSSRKVSRCGRRIGKTDVLAVDMAYHCYTRAGTRVLIVAPYKAQAEEIINRVKGFISTNFSLSNAIVRSVSSPYYEIQFNNGSRIRAFSSGTKSGAEGASIRGQDADRIYLDECFTEGTLVNVSEYAMKPIERLTLSDTVLGGDTNGVITGDILALNKRQSEVITLSTPINTVNLTPNHPLFDGNDDVSANKANEVIVSMAYRNLNFKPIAVKARLIGYNYGDGWVKKDSNIVGFSGQKEDLEQVIEDIHFLGGPKHITTERYVENTDRNIHGTVAQFEDKYSFDLIGHYCPRGHKVFQQLNVPKFIKESKHVYIKANFLSGLFSAKGTHIKYQKNGITPRTIDFRMTSTRYDWLYNWLLQIINLLADVGVSATGPFIKYRQEENRYIGEIRVCNRKKNIDQFVNTIGFCYDVSKAISANIWKLYRWYENTYKSDNWRKNRKIRQFKGSAKKISKNLSIPCSTVKYHKKVYSKLFSERPLTACQVYEYHKTNHGEYAKLPILTANRRSVGIKTVYNLTSTANHRFFGGGLFTHNCDYLTVEDLSAITAILLTSPKVSLWASSTPTGARQHFYQWCMENPVYKEFYFPSTCIPHYKDIEQEFITEFAGKPKAHWDHEVLAVFGEQSVGVFQAGYVNAATSNYRYENIVPDPKTIYSIGVDWNSTVGTEIVVTGYINSRFQVVETLNIPKQEWTQLKGMEEIIRLNRKWDPKFIYVDEGYGATNIELLRKYGYDKIRTEPGTPDAKIYERIRAYNFSSKLDLFDPASGAPIKKEAKPFMVENAVRRFEEGTIMISGYDITLIRQLQNYIVNHSSKTGRPTYDVLDKNLGDHRLDAFMLSLVGFKLEMSKFGLSEPVARINFLHREEKDFNNKSKLPVLPEERFNIDNMSGFTAYGSLPAVPNRTQQQVFSKEAWATDTEEEFARQYRMRKIRKNLRQRRYKPERKNI